MLLFLKIQSTGNYMYIYIKLLRVHQWLKNGFIVFPLIFSGLFVEKEKDIDVCLVLFAFSCLASSIYIINDILDFKRDQQHPVKKSRPLAAGLISPEKALFFSLALMALGLGLGFMINTNAACLMLVYLAIHLIYNFYAKNIVILDVFFIAFGFQLRIWVGSMVIGVLPSAWLQMCVFVLSLFLGFTKRRHEISLLKEKASEHRQALLDYNVYLLDQIIVICSTLTIVFYGLYSFSDDILKRLGNTHMIYSLAFVVFGIFRYLYLVHVKNQGGEPGEVILHDKASLINIMFWFAFIMVLLGISIV